VTNSHNRTSCSTGFKGQAKQRNKADDDTETIQRYAGIALKEDTDAPSEGEPPH